MPPSAERVDDDVVPDRRHRRHCARSPAAHRPYGAPVPELVAIDVAQGPALPAAARAHLVARRRRVRRRPPPRRCGARRHCSRPSRRRGSVTDDGTEMRTWTAARGVEAGDALVVTTSGSTASPRAVVLTHDAVAASALATSARLGVDPRATVAVLPAVRARGRPLGRHARRCSPARPLDVHPRLRRDACGRDGRAPARRSSRSSRPRCASSPTPARSARSSSAAPHRPATPGERRGHVGAHRDGLGRRLRRRARSTASRSPTHDGELFVRGPMLARAYRDGAPVDRRRPRRLRRVARHRGRAVGSSTASSRCSAGSPT